MHDCSTFHLIQSHPSLHSSHTLAPILQLGLTSRSATRPHSLPSTSTRPMFYDSYRPTPTCIFKSSKSANYATATSTILPPAHRFVVMISLETYYATTWHSYLSPSTPSDDSARLPALSFLERHHSRHYPSPPPDPTQLKCTAESLRSLAPLAFSLTPTTPGNRSAHAPFMVILLQLPLPLFRCFNSSVFASLNLLRHMFGTHLPNSVITPLHVLHVTTFPYQFLPILITLVRSLIYVSPRMGTISWGLPICEF
jgi:hypothetical protein